MGDTYGVTPAGFVVKPLDQCLAELEALARAAFGDGIKLNPSSKWGQFLGILAERESEIWDMSQEVHASRDPDQATGAGLDAVCAITGLGRNAAEKSTATVTIGGVAGTVIPAGKVASVTGTGTRFVLIAEATIGGGGTVDAQVEAEATGPLPAPAGTITTIETPVAGWNTVTNAADAVLGSDSEKDPALRMRREQSLAGAGSGTDLGVLAKVTNTAGVVAASVYVNDEEAVVDGMPPHSMEVVAQGGTDLAVATAIWKSKSGGIQTIGTTLVVVQDASGRDREIRFSRPEDLAGYLRLVIAKGDAYGSGGGDDALKAALVEWGAANLVAGATLYPRALLPAIFARPGVVNVPFVGVGLAVNPGAETPIVATRRQRVQLATDRIAVSYE